MSIELRPIRKKRTSSDTSSPNAVSEGDHRKRRRNRTTQSCLNCHTSKRMVFHLRSKAPMWPLYAAGSGTPFRTGLCVYEVDDPSQRGDTQDESSRLRQRVAELEGVIRELKNKPHPRWAKPGTSPSEEFKKCHTPVQSRSASEKSVVESRHQSDLSHPSTTISNADSDKTSPDKQTPCLLDETLQPDYLPSSFSPLYTESSVPLSTLPYSPHFDIHSPPSVPSTGIVTPAEEHPQMQISVAGDHHLTNDIDLASLFMTYPDLLACDEGSGQVDQANTHGQHVDPRSIKYHHGQFLDGHCDCLNEAASYNVVLELSLRLRKAADILSCSANHRFNNGCPLNQRIVDLDVFAMTALGNVTSSLNDFGQAPLRSRANTVPSGPIPPTFTAGSYFPPIHVPAISPPSLRSLRSWNGVSYTSDPSASCDESFMTWEPLRRC
ncbi:hypothetical protein HD554DRAFT_2204380 [Boletus coccyginus]|nr:hypothetical protein HD554DRAFT_2204380 [Boletus coccyginus]